MVELVAAKAEAVDMLLEESQDIDPRIRRENLVFSVNYLNFFGYIAASLLQSLAEAQLKKGIKEFQKWFGLTADGIIGPKTLKAMSFDRCGCNDIFDPANETHQKFLRLQETVDGAKSAWQKKGLTFFVTDYVSGIPHETQLEIINRAWLAWDDVCGIELSAAKSADSADLLIGTGRGSASQFDGRGGILAWSYLPDGKDKQLKMRFDLDETWTVDPAARGVLLFNVACHEFGHMLGLTHSLKQESLMAPCYNPHIAVPQLDDDIARVCDLYGVNVAYAVSRENDFSATSSQTGNTAKRKFVLVCHDLEIEGFNLVPIKG